MKLQDLYEMSGDEIRAFMIDRGYDRDEIMSMEIEHLKDCAEAEIEGEEYDEE